MGLPPSNYYNSSIASTYPKNSSSEHSQSKKQFCSLNPTILLRPTLIRKIKKKGSQQSAVVAESLETSDFRPFRTYYLSLRDIKTTVSTWLERTALMSHEPSVLGNISTVFFHSRYVGTYQRKCPIPHVNPGR